VRFCFGCGFACPCEAKKIRVWEFGILSFCLYSRVLNGLSEILVEMMGLAQDFGQED